MISAYQAATGARFVWRGAANASWALWSHLGRAYHRKFGAIPMEPQLRAFEKSVLDEARVWSLDWHHAGGRLSALELLAALSHYGVLTRMLDFTYNPLIALWFAVEKHDGVDGRVFAIDISSRVVSRESAALADP
jgi:FRG domain